MCHAYYHTINQNTIMRENISRGEELLMFSEISIIEKIPREILIAFDLSMCVCVCLTSIISIFHRALLFRFCSYYAFARVSASLLLLKSCWCVLCVPSIKQNKWISRSSGPHGIKSERKKVELLLEVKKLS